MNDVGETVYVQTTVGLTRTPRDFRTRQRGARVLFRVPAGGASFSLTVRSFFNSCFNETKWRQLKWQADLFAIRRRTIC